MTAAITAATVEANEGETDGARRRSRFAWVLLAPGLAYLVLFFVAPVAVLLLFSFYERVPGGAVGQTTPAFRIANYTEAIAEYAPQFGRSFLFALIATVLTLAIGYPLGVRHRGAGAQPPAAAGPDAGDGDRAVLHQLHPAHDRVEADPRRRERGRRRAAGGGGPARGRPAHRHPVRGGRRAHLQLPALHGAPPLREPRAPRHPRSSRRARTCTRARCRPSGTSRCR